MRKSLLRTVRRRLLGVAFLATLAGSVGLSIAFYNHAFTPVVRVELQADRIGHQLEVPADVKERGIIVGTVTGVHSNGDHATLDLALQPGKVNLIPANVVARILPKTLFGEKFVDLVVPPNPVYPIRRGDVIRQDHSATAIEAEQVFNDLVPLLQTLQPVALNMTLSNLAEALRGRGNQLGDNLVRTDAYFRQFNPHLTAALTDLSGLADLADSYRAATPDLLASARQFSVNARTLVAKADPFAAFLAGTQGFADTTSNVLTRNEVNLVQLAHVSTANLLLLAKYAVPVADSPGHRYSPISCTLIALADQEKFLAGTFIPVPGDNPELHIDLKLINQATATHYTYPANRPSYDVNRVPGFTSPKCYNLPGEPNALIGTPPPAGPAGSTFTPAAASSPAISAGNPAVDLARALAAPTFGVSADRVPDLAATLLAPQLAGMAVSVS